MLRTIILASFTSFSAFTGLRGQSLGAPEWSNEPFTDKGKVPYTIYGPYCADGVSITLASMVLGKGDYVGYIYSKGGQVVRKPVVFPQQKEHVTFTGFCVVGSRPCVLYSLWDKKAGVVSVFIQAYTAAGFDPDGPSLKLCELPSEKSYAGELVHLGTMSSPDGSKMLFLLSNIQKDGNDQMLCWAMDSELNLIWTGRYSIPWPTGSYSSRYFMDNDHFYMRVHGAAATDATDRKHADETWYDMHGEVLHTWDSSVPGMPGVFKGSPVMAHGQAVLAGLMAPEDGHAASGPADHVLLTMNDAFVPQVIKSGSSTLSAGMEVRALSGGGNIFIVADEDHGTSALKLNAAGETLWEREGPESSVSATVVGDQLIFTETVSKATIKQLQEGKTPDPTAVRFEYKTVNLFPIICTWGAGGNAKVQRIFPEDVKIDYSDYVSSEVDDCGCFSALSADKEHPGLVRVCIDK